MNWKVIVVGGVLFFIATWVLAPITGSLIHEGVLADDYRATTAFWRPELMEQPPNMAALLPYWITVGLIGSLIVAGVYSVVRRAFTGSGWLRGLKYGVVLSLLAIGGMLGYSGVFNLPADIWMWWAVEWTAMNLLGGVVLGWVAEKLAPSSAAATPASVHA